MPDGVLVGIDLGTTALKAAAFDARDGAVLAVASQRLPVRVESDGTREQTADAIRQALKDVGAALKARLGPRWREVCGVGLGAQGGSGMIVDRDTGAAHTPMMLWNDSRAFQFLPEIAARRDAAYWQHLAQRHGPGAGLARLHWLKLTRPELFTERHLYAGAGEYACFLLTRAWRQDACNALQIGCYHVPENRLDAEPLAMVGVPLSFVAPLRRGHETHPLSADGAALLDLAAGIPVAGPYMDHEAGYLSAARVSARPLQCSLGTAWVGNFLIPDLRAGASPLQLVIGAPLGEGYLVIQPLLAGNVAWDWGLQNLVDPDHAAALAKLDGIFGERLLPPEGLVTVPWLTQANPWVPGVRGGGTFAGVSAHTSKSDLLRALAAGLAWEFARVFRDVRDRGLVDSVVLGGGASKGRFFRDMFAALFAPLPVYSLADEELAGARGALFAFDPEAAGAKPVPVPGPVAPVSEAVRQGFERYCAWFDKLYADVKAGEPFRAAAF